MGLAVPIVEDGFIASNQILFFFSDWVELSAELFEKMGAVDDVCFLWSGCCLGLGGGKAEWGQTQETAEQAGEDEYGQNPFGVRGNTGGEMGMWVLFF